jgi:SAM-dependent methyltransferase
MMAGSSEFRDKQREAWNEIAVGWGKWDRNLMEWLKPVGDKILELAKLEDGDTVLDVATGSGEPGLTAAKKVGTGRVVGLDISKAMVDIALENAKRRGIKNYEARLYSSSEIPFDSNSFDAVVSRFGLMFFPDITAGLKEMMRVLKPKRRLAVSVWGPPNENMKNIMQVLTDQLGLPEPPPGTPNPYRCSESGRIHSLLDDSGLHNVGQADVTTRRIYESVARFWEYYLDTNPIIARKFNEVDEGTRKVAERKVNDILSSVSNQRGELVFNNVAWVAHGEK